MFNPHTGLYEPHLTQFDIDQYEKMRKSLPLGLEPSHILAPEPVSAARAAQVNRPPFGFTTNNVGLIRREARRNRPRRKVDDLLSTIFATFAMGGLGAGLYICFWIGERAW